MDAKDAKIIGVLKANSRATVREIAEKTRLSVTTVHYRLKNLMKKNTLLFTVRVDREFSERNLVAHVLVKAMPGVNHETLFKKIMQRQEIEEGAIITGEFDLIFKVGVKDMKALDNFVIKHLRLFSEVAETRTMICYSVEEK